MTEADRPLGLQLLAEYLAAANKTARRLQWSQERVARLMPLVATGIASLSDEDEERLDAFLLRFNSLTALVQDHITRALLRAEEEDIKDRSKKDQRLLMEKLGALHPRLAFGTLADHYPDDAGRQAEILNEVHGRSGDLIEGYDSILAYADEKFFARAVGLKPVGPGPR